jgi:hypothetical protein
MSLQAYITGCSNTITVNGYLKLWVTCAGPVHSFVQTGVLSVPLVGFVNFNSSATNKNRMNNERSVLPTQYLHQD